MMMSMNDLYKRDVYVYTLCAAMPLDIYMCA